MSLLVRTASSSRSAGVSRASASRLRPCAGVGPQIRSPLLVRSLTHSTSIRLVSTPAASATTKVATSVASASNVSQTAGDVRGESDASPLFGSDFSHLKLRYNAPLQYLTVTMNRPELHNAFNEVVISELSSVFRTLDAACLADPQSQLGGLRAVVLTGAGASFSAGADLNWMKKMKVRGGRKKGRKEGTWRDRPIARCCHAR